MWIFTKFGFFSIVEKQKGSTLTVRSRVCADLDRLRDQYLPSLGATRTKGGSDYPYRATVGSSPVRCVNRTRGEAPRPRYAALS